VVNEEGTAWKQVRVAWEHGCALDANDTAWCWGSNSFGQVGLVPAIDQVEPVRYDPPMGPEPWDGLIIGPGYSCAYHETLFHCWGSTNASAPPPDPPLPWVDAEGIESMLCYMDAAGEIGCYGSFPAEYVGTFPGLESFTLGGNHMCGIMNTDELWCRGINYFGQLGQGDNVDSLVFEQVRPDKTWVQADAGWGHTYGIDSDGHLWRTGYNEGLRWDSEGPLNLSYVMVQIGGATWSKVADGWDSACGIRTDGTLWCWGRNDVGQLGDGEGGHATPVRVP
jgi:alpha-tubulin suppressor-like RCC1 family protein